MTPSLDAFGMVVEDLERTLAFYRLLGLDVPDHVREGGHVEVEFAPGIRLMFDTVEVVTSFSEWEPPSGGHRMGLAFRCDRPAAVDDTYGRLVAAGHRGHVEPFDAPWGQRYATVLDPDGTPIDLYAGL